MATISDITINIGITVTEEAVRRCCEVLRIYLNDNPKKMLHVDDVTDCDGKRDVILYFGNKEVEE